MNSQNTKDIVSHFSVCKEIQSREIVDDALSVCINTYI